MQQGKKPTDPMVLLRGRIGAGVAFKNVAMETEARQDLAALHLERAIEEINASPFGIRDEQRSRLVSMLAAGGAR